RVGTGTDRVRAETQQAVAGVVLRRLSEGELLGAAVEHPASIPDAVRPGHEDHSAAERARAAHVIRGHDVGPVHPQPTDACGNLRNRCLDDAAGGGVQTKVELLTGGEGHGWFAPRDVFLPERSLFAISRRRLSLRLPRREESEK